VRRIIHSEKTSAKACKTGVIIEARGQENGHSAVCFVPSEKTDTQATRPNDIGTATWHCAFVLSPKTHTEGCKEMEGQETACQKAFCQSVADHCMCPPPANRLCALHWKDTVAWYSFHWNTTYGHETNIHFKMYTKVLQLMSYFPSPRSWNDIFSITKSSQRNPVLTTTPSSCNGCNGATKYEHSIHVPNWKMASIFWSAPTIPSLQDTLQQSNKTSPLSYSTPKKNTIEQMCVVYPRSNRTLSVGIPLCVKFFLWNHFLWLYCHSVRRK
jgi:hypothetical protein